MTQTLQHSFANEDGWLQVSDGSPSVTVQLVSNGPVLVHIGETMPAADSTVGILLDVSNETSFSGNALAATDKCFLRASKVGDTEIATVMST